MPTISIIIPIYNVELYVERCLTSVMRQTYAGGIECILVDDCGTDDSIIIAKRLVTEYQLAAKKHNTYPISFRILQHDHNRGLSAARNTGLIAAKGDYVFFLDSDDELPYTSLQMLSKQLLLHPEVQCVQGFTKTVPMIEYYEYTPYANNSYVKDNLWIRRHFYTITDELQVNAWNKLLKRKFLLDNRLFFQEGILHEDRHWMFFVVKYLQSISFVSDATLIYYRNEGSIMKSQTDERTAKYYKIIVFDWIKNCDDLSLNMQLQTIMYQFYKNKVYIACSGMDFIIFLGKMMRLLMKGRQYKSVFYLISWSVFFPMNKSMKWWKLAYQSIHI